MIIISNKKVNGRTEKIMTYDEFYSKAFSDEGLDTDEHLIVNIHDCSKEVYEAAVESDQISFFSLTGTCPTWCDEGKIEDWSEPKPKRASEQLSDPDKEVSDLLNDSVTSESHNGAKVYVFGSSKGGTGKTFTALISTYRYAKTHPHQKIALVDFDIIDGQVGISIHKLKPTIRKYLSEYQKGYSDFRTMSEFGVRANEPYPQNVDFYLAPSNNARINDDAFWLNVIKNCIENYDVVVFDTGIDYINLRPISYVYKCADKILLITTTSIKSVNSISKQIGRLKGEIPSKDENGRNVFSAEDEIAPHLNIIITQMLPTDNGMNKTIYNTLAQKSNVIATFGVITDSVSRAEFFGEWGVFDRNAGVNKALDDIMA